VHAPEQTAHAPPQARTGGRLRRPGRGHSAAIGALIIVVGLSTSAFVAGEWRSSLLGSERKAFQSTTSDLADALKSRLQANIGLTRTMGAIATLEPGTGETRFLRWYHELLRGGAAVSPDVAATLIQPIGAAQLPAFKRSVEADPAYNALIGGRFQIVPAGPRSVYCLTRAFVGGSFARSVYPVLLDYCAPVLPVLGRSPFPELMRTATDSGSIVVVPVRGISNMALVAVGAAVYRPGAPVRTVAQRQAATTGFIATTFDAGGLVSSLLAGHRSFAMTLYHANPGGRAQLIAAAGGGRGRSGYRVRTALGGGWSAATTATVAVASADAQALVVLASGALITVLFFLLYLVLVRSRRRAWNLVAQKTDELAYLALHDPLTGLPNRTLVLDRAQQLLARGRRLDTPVSALFVDIDGFKQINDMFGHQVGDAAMRKIAGRLEGVLRGSDTIGRLGGDEFVLLIDPVDRVGAERVANRILRALARPLELSEPAHSTVSVAASIGIATGLPNTAEDLLRDADIAMYQAKAIGKGGYVVFESAMQVAAQDRTELEIGLADALEANEFSLRYQPIVELETQRVVAVEALLRWAHPTRGETAPDVFIPIAEATGVIVPIGRWVLEQACAQCAAWQQKGHSLGVSVNVSARQFEHPELVEEVRAALARSGLDAMWLTLEITETALMNHPEAAEAMLIELKMLGVQIAVDDFGTGYSSLGYLRQFPIDSLKLDRSFITGLARSGEANALAHTLIQLGKTLGLRTVAEGVEAYTQLCQLQLEGCDLAQGYLFARPLTPTALEQYLRRGESSARAVATPVSQPVGGR